MDAPSYAEGLIGLLEPFPDRPRAQKVMTAADAHVVVFAFARGQELREHVAHHPVLIQALAGHLELSAAGATYALRPGDLLHLPAKLPHSASAREDSTLTVTMLVGADD